ncbi:MAG: DNA-processing protein DprA [Candidatus Andersenbacteria bacterium]
MESPTHTIDYDSNLYPPLLREIAQPPHQLYVRGSLETLQERYLLAVVGSRKSTHYGKQCLTHLLPPVIRAGLVIVSGMAYGIDALAHRACVQAQRPTIAVLGSGIDDYSIYPRTHITLAKQILKVGGTLVSEYPPGTPGFKQHFPARNRIISGLCQTTMIVQAAQRSGSLITARLALEANRNVCAVPGSIMDPLAAGTNHLIQEGATPIVSGTDILELYGLSPVLDQAVANQAILTPEQTTLLSYLSHVPLHIDDITTQSSLDGATIAALLTELELQDHIQHVGGMKYVKKAVGNTKTSLPLP